MDSHVFRILALELKKYLQGARVEKIHSPAPGLLSIILHGHGLKRVLVMRHARVYNHGSGQVTPLKGERQSPAFYLGKRKLPNPEKPSTLVMTLRKHLSGKRLGAATIDWLNRRIFLPVPQLSPISKAPFPLWLCLDLLNGPRILKELPEYEISTRESACGHYPADGQACPAFREAAGYAETADGWHDQEAARSDAKRSAANSRPVPDFEEPTQSIAPIKAPRWPDFGLLAPNHVMSLQNRELCRDYPVLTPALRKTLACLEPLEAAALLSDLEYETEQAEGSLHLYEFAGKPHQLSAWPLPEALTGDMAEIPLTEEPSLLDGSRPEIRAIGENTHEAGMADPQGELDDLTGASRSNSAPLRLDGLEAARRVYEPQVLAYLGASAQKGEKQAVSSEKRRLSKSLQKLEQEEERLRKLLALREDARLIQGVLWQYAPDARMDSITVEQDPSMHLAEISAPTTSDAGSINIASPSRTINLDPLKSLRENMAWLFKQSDRGERGLAFLETRRKELAAELALAESGLPAASALSDNTAGGRKKGQTAGAKSGKLAVQNAARGQRVAAAKKSPKDKREDKQQKLAKLIQRFTSSDGFTILRGRSAEGNWALLKLVQPHDVWLHVEGGPSAHVVIRRESLGQDIPHRTMLEAGTLSAVKSWRKTDSRAEIICALVKDVRPVKGGRPGSVLVDKIMAGFVAGVDLELENKLSGSLYD